MRFNNFSENCAKVSRTRDLYIYSICNNNGSWKIKNKKHYVAFELPVNKCKQRQLEKKIDIAKVVAYYNNLFDIID